MDAIWSISPYSCIHVPGAQTISWMITVKSFWKSKQLTTKTTALDHCLQWLWSKLTVDKKEKEKKWSAVLGKAAVEVQNIEVFSPLLWNSISIHLFPFKIPDYWYTFKHKYILSVQWIIESQKLAKTSVAIGQINIMGKAIQLRCDDGRSGIIERYYKGREKDCSPLSEDSSFAGENFPEEGSLERDPSPLTVSP